MPSNSPYFTLANEKDLIAMVEERRYLWDVVDNRYHRRDLKEKAYDEIAAALGPDFTAADVKARFSNLRSQFQRETRKVKASQKSGAGSEDLYVPRWAHYDDLFLLSGSPQSDSRSNYKESPNVELLSQTDCSPIECNEDTLQDGGNINTPKQNLLDLDNPQPSCSSADAGASSNVRKSQGTKRKPAETVPSPKRQLLESAVQVLNRSCSRPRRNRDECDDFGVSVANALRQIPQGQHSQMASLLAYEAVVKYHMNLNLTEVEVIPQSSE